MRRQSFLRGLQRLPVVLATAGNGEPAIGVNTPVLVLNGIGRMLASFYVC